MKTFLIPNNPTQDTFDHFCKAVSSIKRCPKEKIVLKKIGDECHIVQRTNSLWERICAFFGHIPYSTQVEEHTLRKYLIRFLLDNEKFIQRTKLNSIQLIYLNILQRPGQCLFEEENALLELFILRLHGKEVLFEHRCQMASQTLKILIDHGMGAELSRIMQRS